MVNDIIAPLIVFGIIFISLQVTKAQDNLFLPENQGLLIHRPGFYCDFDTIRNLPHWVAYELTKQEASGTTKRKSSNYFKKDPDLPNGPRDDHYKWSQTGYQKGHLKPAADSKQSSKQMNSAFLTSNLTPQTKALNQNTWRFIERGITETAQHDCNSLYIITGPTSGSLGLMGETQIDIPTAYWKVVFRTEPDTSCIAFIVPNTDIHTTHLSNYRVPVDSIEILIEFNLFQQLKTETESRIERDTASQWPRIMQ